MTAQDARLSRINNKTPGMTILSAAEEWSGPRSFDGEIRQMRQEDLPLIEWGCEYLRYRRVYREVFRNSLNGKSILWVAVTSTGEMVGQVFINVNPTHAYKLIPSQSMLISSFRVKRDYRGCGIGSSLLKTCERCASEREIGFLWLNCSKSNQNALTFYRNRGFEIFRSDPGDWQYIDHNGNIRREVDPAWSLCKRIG